MTHKEQKKLTVLEIRKDPELIRLRKLMDELDNQYHERIMKLFKENDIKPFVFQNGVGISYNATSSE